MTPPTEGYYNEGEDKSQAKRVKFSEDEPDEEENTSLDEDEKDYDIEILPYIVDAELDREILDTLPTFSDLTLEAQERICPPKNRLFQLFSIRVNFNHKKAVNVYGSILAVDEFQSLKDHGWVVNDSEEGCKYVSLFYHGENDPQPIGEDGLLSLTNPSCVCSIPAFKPVEIVSKVSVTLDDDDGDKGKLEVINCSSTLSPKMYCLFRTETAKSDYGSITMYYTAFKYGVDAVVEVTFTGRPYGNIISGSIEAYCGGDGIEYEYRCMDGEEKYFKVILFKADAYVQLDSAEIPLTRSVMAIPSRGSLVIQALLFDYDGKTILDGKCEFPGKRRNFSTGKIEGPGCCTVSLKVNWKCKAVGT